MSKETLIEQNDNWFRKEIKQIVFDIVDSDGAVVDVSEYEMAWAIQELHDDTDDILSKATGGSGITVGDTVLDSGDNARVIVTIDPSDNEDIESRVYRQALWRTDIATPQLLAFGTAMLRIGVEIDAVSS